MFNVRSLNRVILIGRVGSQPEITHIPSTGRDVARFSLATNEGYTDKNNQWKDHTEWHNIVAWGPLVPRIDKLISKGMLINIEGKLRTRKWQDKSGQERKSMEIEIDNFVLLEKTAKDTGDYANKPAARQSKTYEENAPVAREEKIAEKDVNDPDFPYNESSDPF